MGKFEGPHEVSFSDQNSVTMRKKVAYVLAFLAIATSVVVGLLVYYVGVMGLECQVDVNPENGQQSSTADSGHSKKVKKAKPNWHPSLDLSEKWVQENLG